MAAVRSLWVESLVHFRAEVSMASHQAKDPKAHGEHCQAAW